MQGLSPIVSYIRVSTGRQGQSRLGVEDRRDKAGVLLYAADMPNADWFMPHVYAACLLLHCTPLSAFKIPSEKC